MKKVLALLIIIFMLVVSGFIFRDMIKAQANQVFAYSPCAEPKPYSIGTIDQRFGMTDNEVRQAITEAGSVWTKAYGQELFVYDAASPFKVNFIYDTRQSLNTEINEKNEDLREKDEALRPRIQAYNLRSVAIQEKVKTLNQEIESWNARGGAPDDVFERLKTEQATLREEMATLNQEADALSLSTDELRDEATSLEDTVSTFNSALHDKPEGGKYILDENGERIDIAIFDSRQELINVLSHELGHALGMEHVLDKTSIMYEKTNNAITPSNEDFSELTRVCAARNLVADRWTIFRTNFFSRLGGFISVESGS